MKHNFTTSYSLVYMIGHWWKKTVYPPSSREEIKQPQYRRPTRSQLLLLDTKKLSPTKKYLWMSGGVYIMENKDKNTDYQKDVRVGDKKWKL